MPELKIDQSLAQIEDALLRMINFALRKGLPDAADPAELRARPSITGGSPERFDLDMVRVVSLGKRFYWWQFSTAADNGTTVIKPNDAGATGRWLIVESPLRYAGVLLPDITDGILQAVILHNGDFDEKVLKERIFSRAPCVAIHFDQEKHKAKSQVPGALYDYRVSFEIWSVARCYRDRFEAAIGSPIPAELAADPGVMRIHGMVKKLLAGTTLGLEGTSSTDYSGISHTEIGDGRLERAELAERTFVMSLGLEVRGSLANPDEPFELVAVERIDIQRTQSSVGPTGELDVNNCVTLGLDVPLGIGFAKTIAAGTALIDGVLATAIGTLKTFTASVRTFRDLAPDGTWTFVEAPDDGSDAPAVTAGSMRIGVTTTDAAGVIWDQFIASTYIPSGDPDQIEV